ncbi:MAG: VIT1/CCC1 transporter family protein [bacterium]|nr:VIT1/CCC1 transporter family protein [bacterium]
MKNYFTGKAELLLRNLVFGVEDSLVSTTGLLSGVAMAGISAGTIILTGTILVFVEAFSMAVGSFLSEDVVHEYVIRDKNFYLASMVGGLVMFFSYFIAGYIPLIPYIFFPTIYAFWISIAAALMALFLLGAFSAEMFRAHYLRQGMKMFLVGGMAIAIGILVGRLAGHI